MAWACRQWCSAWELRRASGNPLLYQVPFCAFICAVTETVPTDLKQSALKRWKLIADFQERLQKEIPHAQLHPTWNDPERALKLPDYLSLFLLGLFNPVVKTMRAVCAASHLPRVQEEVCQRPISLGSFSEAQSLVEPELLPAIFAELSQEVLSRQNPPASHRFSDRSWLIQDGSLFEALPRMYWALWRKQGKAQSQVRLHLSLDLDTGAPARAAITPGKTCERKVWKQLLKKGDAYVGDRYYGEDYQLFGQLDEMGVDFVVRLRDEAVINVEEELPLSAADQEAKVIRSAWVKLGCRKKYESQRLRVVWVQTEKEVLKLVTNLGPEKLSAGDVALLYKERWRIELFFRWIKCILGCRHWLAESPQGAAVQIYLALIAALLLQLYTGERPNRRVMELLQFYAMGVASLEDVMAGVERERTRMARRKKN